MFAAACLTSAGERERQKRKKPNLASSKLQCADLNFMKERRVEEEAFSPAQD